MLAVHYCAIQGAVYIPTMGELDDLINQPYGALSMSAAVFPFSTYYIYSQQLFIGQTCLHTRQQQQHHC